MKRGDIIQFLKLCHCKVPAEQKRTGWVICDCPLGPWAHDNGKSGPEVFGVRIESGKPRVHCFSCDYHGDIEDVFLDIRANNQLVPSGKSYDLKQMSFLVDKAGDDFELDLDSIPDIEEMLEQKKHELVEFDEWWIDSFPSALDTPFALDYLHSRGVPDDITAALELRADPNQLRVCAPVRDFKGTYRGLHGRAIKDDTEPRYRMYTYKGRNNPLVWLGEHWVDFDKPVVVVEGYFDLLAVMKVYQNVVSPLFSNPSHDKIKRMAGTHHWVTFLDHGSGGDSGRAKYTKYFGDRKGFILDHVKPPPHRKDPGVCTVPELIEVLEPYVEITPFHLL